MEIFLVLAELCVCVRDDPCGSCVAVTVCGLMVVVCCGGAIADDDADDCCVVGSCGAVFVLGDSASWLVAKAPANNSSTDSSK